MEASRSVQLGRREVSDAKELFQVIISSHSSLGDGQYFDVESSTSFSFDHTTQKASNVQSYVLESANAELM